MMPKIGGKFDCCGCTACANICPVHAISMVPDALGFLYPKINVKKCLNCGACEKVCAFNANYDKSFNLQVPKVYGARHKTIEEVMRSRSGAVFAAISDRVLERGGVIYGAGYSDRFRVVHKRAQTKEERDEFRGSKYVQSDLTGILRRVKADLQNGLEVLFSGTPCQTAALNAYVGKECRGNLILVDLICHGVPSPLLWRDYLTTIELQKESDVQAVDFRNKIDFGWGDHCETLKLSNGEKICSKVWTNLFYKHLMLRYACSNCHFTNFVRPSDITLGDFWGWQKVNADFNRDNRGVSLVLLNTEKGVKLFDGIKNVLNHFEVDMHFALQPGLVKPFPLVPFRGRFERDYVRYGFVYVSRKYANRGASIFRRTICKVANFLRRLTRCV